MREKNPLTRYRSGVVSALPVKNAVPPETPHADGGVDDLCRQVAHRHYENFTVATRLVPPRLRQHLANVYAFARWSDDLADEAASPEQAGRDLAAWRRGLEECFAGRPTHPVFVALADTARRTGLAIEPFAHLLDAFEEDRRFDAAGTDRHRDALQLPSLERLLDAGAVCRRDVAGDNSPAV
ncbi:MAG: hypothetical protein EBX36_00055, partial [Planctomycetia bacterium]|nr:hypothetical protein [Planctomycetia bacterium]